METRTEQGYYTTVYKSMKVHVSGAGIYKPNTAIIIRLHYSSIALNLPVSQVRLAVRVWPARLLTYLTTPLAGKQPLTQAVEKRSCMQASSEYLTTKC